MDLRSPVKGWQKVDRAAVWIGQFWAYFWRRFQDSHCPHSAAALSYTTLLALVPLMAVSLAVFAAFPAYQEVSGKLQDLLFENLVPAARETIQSYVFSFAEKAKKLTGPGILSLIVTALLLMATIEKSLNEIWGAQPYKALLRRFLMYWSVLTLGPLLIGAGIALTSQLTAMPMITETAGQLGKHVGWLRVLPFFLEALAFALLFQIVPNAEVKWLSAAVGGVVSALLFELAKFGFAFYITRFPTYEAIYGAVAAVPIFLVWLYLSWMVTLMGAQFTYCLQTYNGSRNGRVIPAVEHDFQLAYRLLRLIWAGQSQDALVSDADLIMQISGLSGQSLSKALLILQRNGWISKDLDGNWLLRRDPHLVTLHDLYRSHQYVLPQASSADSELLSHLAPVEAEISRSFAITLAALFAEALDGKQKSKVT